MLCDRMGDAGRGGCLAAAAPAIAADARCIEGCGDAATESMRASEDRASISASCGWTGGGQGTGADKVNAQSRKTTKHIDA